MMGKNFIYLAIASILALVLNFLGAWWLVIFGPFLCGLLIKVSALRSFFLGAVAIGLLWALITLLYVFTGYEKITAKMAQLFNLGESPYVMVMLIFFLGCILGGVAGITGTFWRKAWLKV